MNIQPFVITKVSLAFEGVKNAMGYKIILPILLNQVFPVSDYLVRCQILWSHRCFNAENITEIIMIYCY